MRQTQLGERASLAECEGRGEDKKRFDSLARHLCKCRRQLVGAFRRDHDHADAELLRRGLDRFERRRMRRRRRIP